MQPDVPNCAVRELEDPRKMLDQAVVDMQADLVKMRQAAAQARSECPAVAVRLYVQLWRHEQSLLHWCWQPLLLKQGRKQAVKPGGESSRSTPLSSCFQPGITSACGRGRRSSPRSG